MTSITSSTTVSHLRNTQARFAANSSAYPKPSVQKDSVHFRFGNSVPRGVTIDSQEKFFQMLGSFLSGVTHTGNGRDLNPIQIQMLDNQARAVVEYLASPAGAEIERQIVPHGKERYGHKAMVFPNCPQKLVLLNNGQNKYEMMIIDESMAGLFTIPAIWLPPFILK